MSNVLDGRRPSYISIKTLCAELEIGETQVYTLVRQGILPKPLKLTVGCVRWRWESVVLALDSLAGAPAGMTRDDDDDDDHPSMRHINEAYRVQQEAKKANASVPQKRKRVLTPPSKE